MKQVENSGNIAFQQDDEYTKCDAVSTLEQGSCATLLAEMAHTRTLQDKRIRTQWPRSLDHTPPNAGSKGIVVAY